MGILRSVRQLLSVRSFVMWRPVIWNSIKISWMASSLYRLLLKGAFKHTFILFLMLMLMFFLSVVRIAGLVKTKLHNFYKNGWIWLFLLLWVLKVQANLFLLKQIHRSCFFIFFFQVLLKHKRYTRLKYLLIVFIFLQIHLHSLSSQITNNKIKAF